MTPVDHDSSLDLERALLDPGSVFTSPELLLENPRLDDGQKIEILRRWAYDASELAVAEEEGMTGGEPTILTSVLRALDMLTIDLERALLDPGSVVVPTQRESVTSVRRPRPIMRLRGRLDRHRNLNR